MGILRFDLMLQPVYQLVSTMITTDGDEFLGMASNIAAPVVNIVLSIILGRMYGIAGIAMGSVISTVIAFAILGLHFLSKRSSLRPAWYFS
jgi:Na+-driven multidrug efflux pump